MPIKYVSRAISFVWAALVSAEMKLDDIHENHWETLDKLLIYEGGLASQVKRLKAMHVIITCISKLC